jgi:hypothetical protein
VIEMAKSAGNCGKSFVVEPGKKFSLAKIDPQSKKPFTDKAEAKARAGRDAAVINQLQDRMYAERKQALLIVLQGIDCSGKDGTIRSVFNECGPIGVSVSPFKIPSDGGEGARLSLAHPQSDSAKGLYRYLQPFALRRRFGRQGEKTCTRRRHRMSLRRDQSIRKGNI